MAPKSKMTLVDRIRLAQDFFRFSYQIGTPISYGSYPAKLDTIAVVIFGEHHLTREELNISEDTFGLCGTLLERLAYRLLAIELDSALQAKFGDWNTRRHHCDKFIRDACVVIHLLRNAVAHDVLEPKWNIHDPALRDEEFEIPGILKFKTKDANGNVLDGQLVKRSHFGGPIAIFRLSELLLPYLIDAA